MRAQAEEEGRTNASGGSAANSAAEARRWNMLRSVVEARSLLKSLFRAARRAQGAGVPSLLWISLPPLAVQGRSHLHVPNAGPAHVWSELHSGWGGCSR